MNGKLFSLTLSVLLLISGAVFGQSVSLDQVTGLTDMNELPVEQEVSFILRLQSDNVVYGGLTNGFRVYSDDGATWTATTPSTGFDWWGYVSFPINSILTFSPDGMGADTVGFGGISFTPGVGMPANTDTIPYLITIGPIPASDGGKTICLDSSYYPSTGIWKWAGSGGLSAFPAWDGPHCFTVEGGIDNVPPVITPIPDQSIDEGQLLQIPVSATDANGDPITLSIVPFAPVGTFTDNGDGTGLFEWQLGYDILAPDLTLRFEASDGTYAVEDTVVITINQVNRSPILDAIGNKMTDENVELAFQITGSDPDMDAVSFSAAPQPAGFSLVDNGDGTADVSWTPDFTQANTYPITFTIDDGNGGQANELIDIVVNNVNRLPVFGVRNDTTIQENMNVWIEVTATDLDNETLTITTTPLPGTATLVPDANGVAHIDWTTTYDDEGTYPVTFYVMDEVGGADTTSMDIIVENLNRLPVLAEIGDKVVTAGDLLEFPVSASDADGTIPALTTSMPLPGTASFTDNGDGTGQFSWQTLVSDNGSFDITFTASDGEGQDMETITITVGEAPKLIEVTPDSLVFSFMEGDVFYDSVIVSITETNGNNIVVEATIDSTGWMRLEGPPNETPLDMLVIIDPAGLPVGAYTDNIIITSADAANSAVIPVWVYIQERPNNLPYVVLPVDTVFGTDECTPLEVAFEVTDPDGDPLSLVMNGLVENMTFTDNGDGTAAFSFVPNFSQAGGYPLNLAITDGRDTVDYFYTVVVAECEPGTEGDTLVVATVPAVPGARLTVPVDYSTLCALWEANVSIQWTSEHITLDSAVINSGEFALWSHTINIDNENDFMELMAMWTEVPQSPVESANMMNLYFSLAVETPAGFYPLNYYMEPAFTRDCGAGQEASRPFFIPGGIVVDTSGNYVCGYVVDPEGNPIPDAVVELWDDFPGGMSHMNQLSSGTGVFAFSDFNTIPFDLYAFKDGYYPGKVENINFAQSGIMIVLTPTDPVTPTNEWVNFYCGQNTYKGYPLPVGSIVEAYDPDGIKCGQMMVNTEGEYGFLPVYRDDEFADGDQGADPGDNIRFFVNGVEAILSAPATWTEHGASFEVCLDVPDVSPHSCQLFEGWNLVSWNVDTDIDDIMDVLASIDGCLEVVMGFEQGAMTFDVNLQQFSDLWMVDHLSAYWIKVSCDIELEVLGTPVPASTPIPVTAGWNLVSYLPETSYETELALQTIHDDLIVALGYDNGMGQTYVPGQTEFNDLLSMGSCYGYWVKVHNNGTLIYPGDMPLGTAPSRPIATQTASAAVGFSPTTAWMNLYSFNLTLNGDKVEAGAEIEAYTADDQKVGSFTMRKDGEFGFMPVYGDDRKTDAIDGVKANESFYLTVNGVKTDETFTWTTSGDKREITGLTAKNSSGGDLPTTYGLSQNYPNPFNPSTTISFTVPATGAVKVEIYNLLGQLVATPFDGVAQAGTTEVEWDATDNSGKSVASGIYLYRLTADNYTETKKMTLLK